MADDNDTPEWRAVPGHPPAHRCDVSARLMPIVYIAINRRNGLTYIGYTTKSLNIRRGWHAAYAKDRRSVKAPFSIAIREFGIDAFDFSVLVEVSTVEEALSEEVRLISEHKPAYNRTRGGSGNVGCQWSPESREIIAASKRGNKYRLGTTHTPEVKERLRAAGKATKHISLANLEKAHAAASKKVVCLTDGTIHVSASAAARYYKVGKSSVIEVCLKKPKRITAGGHRFEYVGASCQE